VTSRKILWNQAALDQGADELDPNKVVCLDCATTPRLRQFATIMRPVVKARNCAVTRGSGPSDPAGHPTLILCRSGRTREASGLRLPTKVERSPPLLDLCVLCQATCHV
jgi:hypothetical protein